MEHQDNDILKRLIQIKPQIKVKYHVASLALFGSFARGDFTPESDIDILVEFSQTPGIEIVDLVNDLEALLGKRVDLVSKKALKPRYLEVIERELINV